MYGYLNTNSTLFHSSPTLIKAMKYSFFLKTDYKNKDGKYPLYLNLYIHGQRKRIPVDVFLKKTDWDQKKQVIKTPALSDYNLILKELTSQINKIEIQFRLNGMVLTVAKCAELIKRPDASIDFIFFMEYEMGLKGVAEGTYKNHKVALENSDNFNQVLFLER